MAAAAAAVGNRPLAAESGRGRRERASRGGIALAVKALCDGERRLCMCHCAMVVVREKRTRRPVVAGGMASKVWLGWMKWFWQLPEKRPASRQRQRQEERRGTRQEGVGWVSRCQAPVPLPNDRVRSRAGRPSSDAEHGPSLAIDAFFDSDNHRKHRRQTTPSRIL